jgi:hypothetical protein
LARSGTQHLQRRQGLAHHAAAALGKRDEVLAQMGEVLLDREAADRGSLSAIAIPKLGTRPIPTEEFVLDALITDRFDRFALGKPCEVSGLLTVAGYVYPPSDHGRRSCDGGRRLRPYWHQHHLSWAIPRQ